MNKDNFLKSQKELFQNMHEGMIIDNHKHHDNDPDYYGILLSDIIDNQQEYIQGRALDFGCGCGRNMKNMLDISFAEVNGCDISKSNVDYAAKYAKSFHKDKVVKAFETEGSSIGVELPNHYDFIMSHLVFQHIPNYQIRYEILESIYFSLKSGGRVCLHFLDMDTYINPIKKYFLKPKSATYFENSFELKNCRVENENFLKQDFLSIGFVDVEIIISKDYFSNQKAYYVKASK